MTLNVEIAVKWRGLGKLFVQGEVGDERLQIDQWKVSVYIIEFDINPLN